MNKKPTSKSFKISTHRKHYFEKYDSEFRFISYFCQIDLVKKLKPNKVLEIGIGNKTVANYLKQSGIKIDTCDFDKNLEPDYVADIRNLPFKDKSYDIVIACEILEHIPWEDLDKALSEIHRISKKYAIISVPYSSISFELVLKMPLISKIVKKPYINLFFRMPFFFRNTDFLREHYWEIGLKNYPLKKIRKTFSKYFKIKQEVRPILKSAHHFFILKKKQCAFKLKKSTRIKKSMISKRLDPKSLETK